MMSRRLLLLATVGVLLAGCGGGTNPHTQETAQPGFYRGTVTFPAGGPLPAGTTPVIGDLRADGSFNVYAYNPPFNFTIFSDGSAINYSDLGTIANGTVTTSTSGETFAFDFQNEGSLLTGALNPSALPTMGTQMTVPPSGTYRGELLVVSNGHAVALGRVTDAFVSEDGVFTAPSGGGGAWVSNGMFSGTFDGAGRLTDGTIIVNGGVMGQPIAPQYSYDGTTLIVKYDSLPLEPASAWLVLTAASGT